MSTRSVRVPAGTAGAPDPFVVYIDSITSTAGSIDLLLEESLRDTGPTGRIDGEGGRAGIAWR